MKFFDPLQEVGLLIDSAIQWIVSLGHQKFSGTKNGGVVPYKAVLGMGLPFHTQLTVTIFDELGLLV